MSPSTLDAARLSLSLTHGIFPVNGQRAALQLLRDLQQSGISHLPMSVESPSSAESAPTPLESTEVIQSQEVTEATTASASVPANKSTELEQLAAVVSECRRCQELAATRTQTVFGVGNPNARVMFIGEAPGADEDAQGEPFVGKAGQLLNKIIGACGWERNDLYICNILRCRSPGNRNPTDEEAAHCREYLDGQISVVAPDYIVCWGSVAAKNLLNTDSPIGKMRGKFFEYGQAKVLCTYHPSYLLRNPSAKKPVWEDMKFLMADMGHTPPAP